MVEKNYVCPEIGLYEVEVEKGFAGSEFGAFNFPGAEPEETNYGDFSF